MRFGLLAMVAGVILLVPGLIGSWFFLSDLLFSPAHTVPGAIEKTLDSGTYLVSIETSSTNSYGPVSVGKGKGVRVFSLTVFNPAGDEIELRDGSNQSNQQERYQLLWIRRVRCQEFGRVHSSD